MSKSAIYTVNLTPTTVSPAGVIPLGATIRRFGCNIMQDGNTITITGRGYYLISVSATVTPTTAGDVGVTILKDGVEVTGATATDSVSTVGDSASISLTAILRNGCDCGNSLITFVLNTTESSVENFAVTIVKL